MVGHVLALHEVGQQQPVLHGGLDAMLVGEGDEAMGVERVGPLGDLEVELQPVVGGRVAHPLDDPHRLLRPAELAGVGVDDGRRLGRGAGVELIRLEHHRHVVAALEPLQGGLEAALADVAPGTDDVGVDLDQHLWLEPPIQAAHSGSMVAPQCGAGSSEHPLFERSYPWPRRRTPERMKTGAAARGPPNFRVSQSAPFRRGSSAGDIVRLLRCGRAQPEAWPRRPTPKKRRDTFRRLAPETVTSASTPAAR